MQDLTTVRQGEALPLISERRFTCSQVPVSTIGLTAAGHISFPWGWGGDPAAILQFEPQPNAFLSLARPDNRRKGQGTVRARRPRHARSPWLGSIPAKTSLTSAYRSSAAF